MLSPKRIAPIVAVVFVSACHTPEYRLATAANIYFDAYRTYGDTCEKLPEAHKTCADFKTGNCRDFCLALNASEADLRYAGEALKRGGNISPQYDRVKKSIKQLKKVNP